MVKRKKKLVSILSLYPSYVRTYETADDDVFLLFNNLANEKTDFEGVQSNLQFKKNYWSDNKRLETKFSIKNDKIKAI